VSLNKVCYFFHIITALALINNAMAVTLNQECNPSLITILSIDGGGTKGIIPAILLSQFEHATAKKTAQLFDFMVGVSTGSLVVSLLATPNAEGTSHYTADEIVKLFEEKSPDVFAASFMHKFKTISGLIGPRFESGGMERLSQLYFRETTMSQLLSHVAIFAYDLNKKGVVMFTNWRSKQADTSYYNVRNVIQGTTAIMSYFSPKELVDTNGDNKYLLADASFVVNNPSAMAFLFAYNRCPNAKHYVVVSLATGKYPGLNIQPQTWGIIQWATEMVYSVLQGETAAGNAIMTNLVNVLNATETDKTIPRVLFVRMNPRISWDQSDPTNTSLEHLLTLEKITKNYTIQHQARMNCLTTLLKNHSYNGLSKDCVQLLEHKAGSELFLDLI
jgi:patatin-like phospholipase/acyl hydrolase